MCAKMGEMATNGSTLHVDPLELLMSMAADIDSYEKSGRGHAYMAIES